MSLIQSYGGARAASVEMKQMGTVTAKINYEPQAGNFFMTASCAGLGTGLYATIGVNWKQNIPSETDLAEQEFKRQKEAFMKKASEEPLFLAPYRGKFIASRDGQIVESDNELSTVTDRFFTRYGDVPVYIGRVDGKRKVFIDSPNRVR